MLSTSLLLLLFVDLTCLSTLFRRSYHLPPSSMPLPQSLFLYFSIRCILAQPNPPCVRGSFTPMSDLVHPPTPTHRPRTRSALSSWSPSVYRTAALLLFFLFYSPSPSTPKTFPPALPLYIPVGLERTYPVYHCCLPSHPPPTHPSHSFLPQLLILPLGVFCSVTSPFIFSLPRFPPIPTPHPISYRRLCGTYIYNMQFDAPPITPDTTKLCSCTLYLRPYSARPSFHKLDLLGLPFSSFPTILITVV